MGALLLKLRRELVSVADVTKAPGMQAYMKSSMPYHGVPVPVLRQVCRRVFSEVDLEDAGRWRAMALGLWRGATHREERHAAIALTGDKRARRHQDPSALGMYEELIVEGAWWDYVDEIATHRLDGLLRDHPAALRPRLLAWSHGPDLWLRRSAILAQNTFKAETDLGLLYACIAPSLDRKEFFLRKAIGWALRQLAWTDPAEVRRYVREHEAALSPLSRREALKNL